ncbi:MAG: hypothetical protein L0Y57_06200 [Beijerinckiaceae bacterium]|nr:hypothetical protein [Beijerinckiaceae bacterium]
MLRPKYGNHDLNAARAHQRAARPGNLARGNLAVIERAIQREIKAVARRYALCPSLLDGICANLSLLSPAATVEATKAALGDQCALPHRWLGLGVEVQFLNLRGAMLYARYLRAKNRQIRNRRRNDAVSLTA